MSEVLSSHWKRRMKSLSSLLIMSFRYMRVFVFFDLPTTTVSERRTYRNFRQVLVKNGFIMMQESVYSKITLNSTAAKAVVENIRKNAPEKGSVMLMIVTEKQYENIEYITGDFQSEFVTTPEKLVVL